MGRGQGNCVFPLNRSYYKKLHKQCSKIFQTKFEKLIFMNLTEYRGQCSGYLAVNNQRLLTATRPTRTSELGLISKSGNTVQLYTCSAKMAEQKKTDVNLTPLYTELNKFGNNEDYIRAIKVAKKSKLKFQLFLKFKFTFDQTTHLDSCFRHFCTPVKVYSHNPCNFYSFARGSERA